MLTKNNPLQYQRGKTKLTNHRFVVFNSALLCDYHDGKIGGIECFQIDSFFQVLIVLGVLELMPRRFTTATRRQQYATAVR
ncbi:hypothetical protein T07_3411 [Trichinella nelsoni]|uniref:Uncharacterized protein n=1 Tax=Trichinella nelsoni TaxID=6336 RepID=A0A0V0RZE8_9BILA|nr:hypothetical protein T07_3411 [Trichinella nelsoni]